MSDPPIEVLQPDLSSTARRHLKRLTGVALLVIVAIFATIAINRNWEAVRNDLGLLTITDYALSTGAAAVGLVLLWMAWSTVLRGLGSTLGRHDSLTIYFAAQLGKYVPGSVWPAVIQARLGRRNGVPVSRMVVSYALWMAVLCTVGAITSALVLSDSDVGIPWQVVLACVLVALAVLPLLLHDRGIPRAITWAMRRGGRSIEPIRLERACGLSATVWSAATWLVFGLHAWFLARPLGADLGDLPLVVGAFALAFVAGVAAVPLPAGAGLRETVLVLTLGAAIGRPGALTVALLSRLIMVLVEVALATATGVPAAMKLARRSNDVVDAQVLGSRRTPADDAASVVDPSAGQR